MILGAVSISKAKRKNARCSAPVTGVIFQVDEEQETDDNGRNLKRHSYTPHYKYVVNGQEYCTRAGFSSGNEKEFTVGAPVNVLYNPGDPKESIVAGRSTKSSSGFGVALLLFGVVVMIIGAVAQ